MSSSRPILRRLAAAMLAVGLVAALMAVPTSAATTAVTGTLSYAESVTLTPSAVAVVTIVDQTAAADAGAIVGEEWIGAPPTIPIDFSVLIDSATLDPTHAYALFATITDGTNVWQNPHGEPVITGGPVSGIDLVLPAVPATAPASITGTIVPPADAAYGPGAVEIASLVKVETGTLVSRQVRPITGPADLAFTIGFDPALIDPTATYVVKGAIVDGAAVWENKEGAPIIQGGKAGGPVSLSVTRVATDLPVVTPAPSAVPERIGRPVLVAERRAERQSERVGGLVVHARPDRDADGHSDSDCDAHADTDADRDSDADPDADSDAHAHADADPDTDAHADAESDRDAQPDRVADGRAIRRPDPDPGHRDHRDADLSRAVQADQRRVRRGRARPRLGSGHRELDRRLGDRSRRQRRARSRSRSASTPPTSTHR